MSEAGDPLDILGRSKTSQGRWLAWPIHIALPSEPPLGLDIIEHGRTPQGRWLAWLSLIRGTGGRVVRCSREQFVNNQSLAELEERIHGVTLCPSAGG